MASHVLCNNGMQLTALRAEAEHEEFMGSVSNFENMLVLSGVKLFKYYLDISKTEQKKRLEDRRSDPLKQWKVSPIDDQALKHWKAYSLARNEMLARSHNPMAPWTHRMLRRDPAGESDTPLPHGRTAWCGCNSYPQERCAMGTSE